MVINNKLWPTMSEGRIISAKCRLLDLFSEISERDQNVIEEWICSRRYLRDLKLKKNLEGKEKSLAKIGDAIKKIVPFEAEMPSENIIAPTVGDQADCNTVNTYHVDEFLYDQEAVDIMSKDGKLPTHYCLNCNSRKIKELILISHSMSRKLLQYAFHFLLPKDLEGKIILDVGSRLGAVIFGAYHLSNASTIIGIEMNKEFCEVQEKIIDQFSMDNNRIKVINSDVTKRADIVKMSNIIVINVLDFFVDIETHKAMWFFFKKYIKKGSYLLCSRSMAETLDSLNIFEEFENWLSICVPNQQENEIFFEIADSCDLYLYTIQ